MLQHQITRLLNRALSTLSIVGNNVIDDDWLGKCKCGCVDYNINYNASHVPFGCCCTLKRLQLRASLRGTMFGLIIHGSSRDFVRPKKIKSVHMKHTC
jgi:hypothetical protein